MLKCLAIIGSLTFALPAFAQELPRFDVAKHCNEIASFGGTYSASTDNFCINEEQQAYDELKERWADYPPTARANCIEIASFGGGDYSTLQFCIGEEVDAMNAKPEFKF